MGAANSVSFDSRPLSPLLSHASADLPRRLPSRSGVAGGRLLVSLGPRRAAAEPHPPVSFSSRRRLSSRSSVNFLILASPPFPTSPDSRAVAVGRCGKYGIIRIMSNLSLVLLSAVCSFVFATSSDVGKTLASTCVREGGEVWYNTRK